MKIDPKLIYFSKNVERKWGTLTPQLYQLIVFDWNDPNAEFELQFVNPNKKYFKWAHTKFESMDRMMDEIKNGYHTEEFIIDDAEPGEWLFNIEGLAKEDALNPTYLKYTVYKNYGLPEETKEIKHWREEEAQYP